MKSLYFMPLFMITASCGILSSDSDLQDKGDPVPAQLITYKPVPRVTVAGEPLDVETMHEYAEALEVPAVALAIYKDGNLVLEEFKGDGIGPNSLFQGASFAKSKLGSQRWTKHKYGNCRVSK